MPITATAPALGSIGDKDVRVTNTNGTFGTLSNTLRYTDPSVVLLLHFDGADASTWFPDVTGRHAATRVGDVKLSATTSRFGGTSAYFDGAGDYLDFANSADFNFGTGDFTVGSGCVRPPLRCRRAATTTRSTARGTARPAGGCT